MYVKDLIELCKIRLKNISISKEDDNLRRVLFLGVTDLYDRFNLSVKNEVVKINTNLSLYTLRNKDVLMILDVYDKSGRSLLQTDVLDTNKWDYKLVNYRSFILRKPTNDDLYVVYKASPESFEETHDYIDLPDTMIEALMLYSAYAVNSTITSMHSTNGRGGASETDILYNRYLQECMRLENMGYKIALAIETPSIYKKGYV